VEIGSPALRCQDPSVLSEFRQEVPGSLWEGWGGDSDSHGDPGEEGCLKKGMQYLRV